MIVKFIPENDAERKILGDEPVHRGVSDVFVFGKEKDADGDMVDFHFWKGSYQFLLGNLSYFSSNISDEQRMKMGFKKLSKNKDIDVNNSEQPQLTKTEGVEDSMANVIQFPKIDEIKDAQIAEQPEVVQVESEVKADEKTEKIEETKEVTNEDTNNKV